MSPSESSARPRRVRNPKNNGRQRAKTAPVTAPTPTVSAEQRRSMIAEAAYLRAAQRGFHTDPVSDWLASEKEVDALLERSAD
jgi:hypothetical protein